MGVASVVFSTVSQNPNAQSVPQSMDYILRTIANLMFVLLTKMHYHANHAIDYKNVSLIM